MNTTLDLKPLVESAVHREWDAFAADHPNLAKVLSEELIVETAVADLQHDPDYQRAIATAHTAGVAAETIGRLVDKLVGKVLKKFV